MASYTWVGSGGSITASTSTNWQPNGVPGTNDTAFFDKTSAYDCTWDIASIGEIKCEMAPSSGDRELGIDYGYYNENAGTARTITFTTNVTAKGIYFNCIFKATAAREISFTGINTLEGRYLTFGELAAYDGKTNFTFKMDVLNATSFGLEDGEYPHLDLSGAGTWAMGALAAHTGTNFPSGFTTVDIQNLTVSATTGKPASYNPINDRKKKFTVNGTMAVTVNAFDAGLTSWTLTASSGGFRIPTTGDTSNFGTGTSFSATWHNLTIQRGSADGQTAYISDGLTLICDSFTIKAGAHVKPQTNTKGNGIKTNSTPSIDGSWDFFRVGGGFYHSAPTNAVYMPPKIGSTSQVLSVVNGVPDWSTITADVSAQSTIDIGPLIVGSNRDYGSIVIFGTLTL